MSNASLVSQISAVNRDDVDLDETFELDEPADQESPSWYPISIQPGIPRLPALPSGWARYELGDLLRKVERPATLVDDKTYQLVTARRSRGGIVPRAVLRGDQVLTKTQFYVEAGDFLISNRQISHGACGLVPMSLHNAVVSNEYTAFRTSDALDLSFLNALSNSIYFQQTCFHSSIGVHVEKLVFRLEDWLRCRFNIPALSEQRRIVAVLDSWDKAIRNAEQLRNAHLQRRSGFRTKLLSGKERLVGRSEKWRIAALHEVLHEHGNLSSGQEAVFSVSVHKGLVNQMSHLGRSFAAKQTANYNRVFPGDIVYTKSPTGEFPFGIVKQSTVEESVIVSPLYGVFTPLTHAIGVLIDAYFESPIAAKNYLVPLVQKGAKNTIAITNQRFLSGTIALPANDKETEELASIMQVSKAAIKNLALEIRALKNQKLGLMQKLLTGQTRLDERFDSVSTPAIVGKAPTFARDTARKLSGRGAQ